MTNEEVDAHFQNMMMGLNHDYNWMVQNRPLLAHYTSIEVMENILREEEIWFSNPLFMNDLEEMRFGMLEGQKIFKESDAIANVCSSNHRFTLIQRNFDYLFYNFEDEHAFNVYVFCLSEHDANNADGVRSMWRGYGGQGNGVALVFNTGFVTPKIGSPLIIAKVQYESGEQRKTWIRQQIHNYCAPLIDKSLSDQQLQIVAYYMFDLVKTFALTWKHHGFSEEREWRVIYMPDRDKNELLKDRFSYSIGRRGIEPKLKFKIRPLPFEPKETWTFASILDKIILGPSVASPLAQNGIRQMLRTIKKPEFCAKVIASGIPLRPI